ncbi:hypothetical protein Hanom_Chr05g00421911 [Helianthus anomalus]
MSVQKETTKDTGKKVKGPHVPAWEKTMNIACYLSDPPKSFDAFKSLIVGLNTCRLAHSLRENPVICEDWIKDFWDNSTARKGDSVIMSKVRGTEVSISEQDIREVLLFGDAADDPIEYSKEKVMEVLIKMSYEGATPPPTIKKLLHPYWRMLAHVYLVCISGNKSGLDKLTLKQTSAVVSLVEGWKYNYSKSVFDDMFVNVKTLNEKYWYKFPRFIQMILEKKYPKLPVTVKTYDAKMMNHSVFTWINQKSRENVGVKYENKRALTKFGNFAEIQEAVPTQINAIVAEEHDVEIVEPPVGTQEPIENVDLTGIESEEDVRDDRTMEDEEKDEYVHESETEIETMNENPTAETILVSPPHVESITEATVDDRLLEDPVADLQPRKRSRRDPRLSGEINVQVTPEISNPFDTSQPKINYTPSELNPKIIDFILDDRSAMYMPAPKPGEGSSSGPSDADVIRAAELLQAAAAQVEMGAKSKQAEVFESAETVESSDSDDIFEENETTILMRRISTLEEDKIFKDAQIASLMEELVVKNQKINELETNLGELSAVVMDIKQKLQGKFPKEFADPPKETTAEEREQQRKEHEDAMNRYYESTPRTANQKPRKRMVIMRNVGAERNLEFGDQPDRYVITTEKKTKGNRSGIVSWAYNDEKGMFIVLRKNNEVEYYESSEDFNSWTPVDLRELSNAGFHDQVKNPHCKIGFNFYKKLQQQARVNFKDMKLAESKIVEDAEVLDPATGKPYKTVEWPATKQANTVPLLKELPDNTLKGFKFWVYDQVSGQAVIVCDDVEYRFIDTRDLMCFGENDINLLAKSQIQSDPEYEVCAKGWTGAVAQIINLKLWSGQRSRVETQLFGPYVGRSIPILPELRRKQKERARKQKRKQQ